MESLTKPLAMSKLFEIDKVKHFFVVVVVKDEKCTTKATPTLQLGCLIECFEANICVHHASSLSGIGPDSNTNPCQGDESDE